MSTEPRNQREVEVARDAYRQGYFDEQASGAGRTTPIGINARGRYPDMLASEPAPPSAIEAELVEIEARHQRTCDAGMLCKSAQVDMPRMAKIIRDLIAASPGTVTEREARAREQIAFSAGASWRSAKGPGPHSDVEADRRYPLPTRRALREEQDPHVSASWRFRNGAFEARDNIAGDRDTWTSHVDTISLIAHPTTLRVKLWADLAANPYREELDVP